MRINSGSIGMSKNCCQAENEFAQDLVATLASNNQYFSQHPENSQQILVKKDNNEFVRLNLTPFHAHPQPATASKFFTNIRDTRDLIGAYKEARQSMKFEEEIDAIHVHKYAEEYLDRLLQHAQHNLTEKDAYRIAQWVKNFDVYVAVKCIESLLSSKADLSLLALSETLSWNLHFDHLAIRCGTSKHHHAESVAQLLIRQHGYVHSQVENEVFYKFADGWNAYLLYKILDNGQILRLFIDQSDADDPDQIIQHWNYVYGFTAHHLAIRATKLVNNQRFAVTINEIKDALHSKDVEVMTPTGMYTHGLLQQVFARPEIDEHIPEELTRYLAEFDSSLEETIKNAKLLELVSRSEMSNEFARRFYKLYGLHFDIEDPLHTASIYNYFLPAQAAHVIKTSLNLFQ